MSPKPWDLPEETHRSLRYRSTPAKQLCSVADRSSMLPITTRGKGNGKEGGPPRGLGHDQSDGPAAAAAGPMAECAGK